MRRRHVRRPSGSPFPVTAFWCAVLLLVLPILFFRLPQHTPTPAPTMNPQADAVLDSLPAQLSLPRRLFIERACTLVGHVPYFWGGKSTVLGWDSRWYSPVKVTAAGCDDTGKTMPFGLDCSGFVTWAAVNALDDPSAISLIGDGVRDQYAHCTPIAWNALQPGDLVFFPDLSHIGIMAGWSREQTVVVIHCSRSLGGVVVTRDGAQAGFTQAARPVHVVS